MLVNNIRRNPFLVAPALVFFMLLIFGGVGFLPLKNLGDIPSYIIMMLITVLAFALPTAVFFYIRGNALPHFGFRTMTGEGLSVSLTAAAVLILQGVVIGGFFSDTYTYKTYTIYGSSFYSEADSVGKGILLFFAFAVLPVFFEGIFFRGILSFEYRRSGFLTSAFFSSLFYAMTAMDFSRFPVRFLTGFLLCAVVFWTGNLLCSMLTHAVYAVFSIFLEKYFIFIARESEARTLFFFVFGSLLLLAVFALIRSAEKILRVRGAAEEAVPMRMPKGKRPLVLYDIFSAPMLWADAFCFVLFALLTLLL